MLAPGAGGAAAKGLVRHTPPLTHECPNSASVQSAAS